jgi:tetratricopeptide (TPR) repeat protein
MARDLRKRVTLAIIVPLFLGMIIITVVTCVPLYLEYKNYIHDYDQHMVKYEEHIMMELNKVIAVRQSVGILGLASAFTQLTSNLITNVYFGRIEIEKDWENLGILKNYTDNPQFCDTCGIAASDLGDITKDAQYLNTSRFYYLMQPIVSIGKKFPQTIDSSHLTFIDDFFGLFPCNVSKIDKMANDYNPASNKYSFSLSQFWNLTQITQKLTFIPGNITMVCKPLTLQNKAIGTLVCVNYDPESLKKSSIKYSDEEELRIVDENFKIYLPINKLGEDYCQVYFGFNCTDCTELKNQTKDLDIEKSSKTYSSRHLSSVSRDSSVCDIPKAIKSHTSHINSVIEYDLPSKPRKVSAVSPINISLPLLQDSVRTFSSILETKKTKMSQKFVKLSVKLSETIYIQIIVFTVVLIGNIVIVLLISYKITSSVISPIDDLYNILKRLHKDLGVNVKSHIKKGPPEVTDLYEVFDRLRLILRFEDAKLFKDPTEALMNYAQALRLFHSFNNKRAMEKCFQEIGNLHVFFDRQLEAAMNYHCSLMIAQEIGLEDSEIACRQIKTATAMLKAKTRVEKGKNLFYQALNHFSNKPVSMKVPIYLDLIECLLMNKDNVYSEMSRAEEYLKVLEENCETLVLVQRFRYLQALDAYNKERFRLAAELCTEALEGFCLTDRAIRRKCLSLLKKIFKKFQIPVEQIDVLNEGLKEAPKDLVVVFEKRLADGVDEGTFQGFTDNLFVKNDRISFIQFDESCQVICNLTTSVTRRTSLISSLLDFNKTLLYDAVHMALVQLSSINSIIPQSFLAKEGSRKQWILVITCGEDNGSEVNQEKLLRKLYSSSANLVVVLVSSQESVIQKIETLVKVTPFGILINCRNFLDIQKCLLEAAAYVSQSDSIFV